MAEIYIIIGQSIPSDVFETSCHNCSMPDSMREADSDGRQDLYLMHIAVWNIRSHQKPLQPTVDFVVDLINNKSDLLPGYRLNLIHSITQVSSS